MISQKKLFCQHSDSILSQLTSHSDPYNCIVEFDLRSQMKMPVKVEVYTDYFDNPDGRKWFEDIRAREKLVCVFNSYIFIGEQYSNGMPHTLSVFNAFSADAV